MRFFTADTLVNRLEEAQKQYQLERYLTLLDKTELLICDELGYLSFSRAGAELLFQVFTDRYELASLLLTSNLAFSDCGQVFQGERMAFFFWQLHFTDDFSSLCAVQLVCTSAQLAAIACC